MHGRLAAGAAVALVAGIALPVIGATAQTAQASGGVLATSYTEQTGYPVLNNTGTTLSVTTAAVGDVMLVMAHTAPSSGISEVTSITDSSSRITWQPAKSAGFTNHPSGDAEEIWYGVVKSVGSTTIDVHWSGTTFDHFVWAAEWSSGQGATTSWSLVASGIKNSARRNGDDLFVPDADRRVGRWPLLGLGLWIGRGQRRRQPRFLLLRHNRSDTSERPRLRRVLGRRRHVHADVHPGRGDILV